MLKISRSVQTVWPRMRQREYLLQIGINLVLMIGVLLTLHEQPLASWVAIESLFIDFIFLAEFLFNHRLMAPRAYRFRLAYIYLPIELAATGVIIYSVGAHNFVAFWLNAALVLSLYNEIRLKSRICALLSTAIVGCGVTLSLYGRSWSGVMPLEVVLMAAYAALGAYQTLRWNRAVPGNAPQLAGTPENHLPGSDRVLISSPQVLYMFSELAESRTQQASNHNRRMAHYSRILAQACKLDSQECALLAAVAPLHDIGKLGIPERILTKPSSLTAEERLLIEQHPAIGAGMLRRNRLPLFQTAAIISDEHHERFDGQGYPAGKKGESIHLYGRIVAVADVFDTLMSKRCYKDAWDIHAALEYLESQKDRHFDGELVELFFENIDPILTVHRLFADT